MDFLSLAELVETIQVPSGREARWPDFAAWFARHQGAFKLREPHRIFEEVTGVLTGSPETGPRLTLGRPGSWTTMAAAPAGA